MTRRVAGRYALAEQIGAGGSSRVFAAVDERLGRRVAVKVLDAQLAESADPRSRDRFLREGPTSASFLHRHAVAVFDAGQDADDLYIVMELVDGPSLAHVLATRGRLPVAEATRIAMQVLSALAAAHDAGIVHRDVKPGNILIAPDGDAKLTDFGIAKRFNDIEESVTNTGTTIGTPGYLTPEQAMGDTLSPATDVYAMGTVLFEMLTGRTAFRGDSPVAVALIQQTQLAPDVREFRAEVSTALASVVARALERVPVDRYATAAEMGGALGATSPALGPLPDLGIATAVMSAPLAARSGDTAIMPVAPATPSAAEQPRSSAAPRRLRLVVAIVATVLALVALAAILRRGDDYSPGTTSVTTLVPPNVAGTDQSAIEPTATTVLAPAPIVEEVIPGFARTDDLATFLAQIQTNPALVGSAGTELGAELDRLLQETSERKQRDRAKELTKNLEQWVEAQQLDPAISQALIELLAPLTARTKP